MTTIVDLIKFEEGFRSKPYLCSEGYPTVGYGFKLGPKFPKEVSIDTFYDFELPQVVADVWLKELVVRMFDEMADIPITREAITRLNTAGLGYSGPYLAPIENPRLSVLVSMAYQMGVKGLASFKNTLTYIAQGDFNRAATNMLKSKWAVQTPARAQRHAEQMRTGKWFEGYGK